MSWILFVMGWMSFLKAPDFAISEAAIANAVLGLQHNNDFILNYDNLDFMTNTLMLDNIAPILDYDMWRYVDQAFLNSRYFFYGTLFNFETYNDYLRILVEEYGKKLDIELYGSWESHHLFLFSTLKKLYILQYTDFQLDQVDFYILDWAKQSMSLEEFFECRNLVINNPDSVSVIIVKDDI